jgi:hypothetical protein
MFNNQLPITINKFAKKGKFLEHFGVLMTHKEALFAGLHILMRAITDGSADAGRSLGRYWYRESRCKVRIGWKKTLCSLWLYSSCSSCLRREKICEISVNPRLINDLRLRKFTYEIINLFLQNEPNFRKSQVNITDLLTREYGKMDTWSVRKNKAKTKPIQSQYKPNSNPKQTQFKPKTNPIQTQTKPIHRSVASGKAGTNPASKRRKITCFGISYPYNYWFGINIGDFLCVNNAAVVVLKLKQLSKTR